MKYIIVFFFALFSTFSAFSQSYKVYIKDIENGNYTQLDDETDLYIQKIGSGDILKGRIKKVEVDKLVMAMEGGMTDTFAFDSISQLGTTKPAAGKIFNTGLNAILIGVGGIVTFYGVALTAIGVILSAQGGYILALVGACLLGSGVYLMYKGFSGMKNYSNKIKYIQLIPGKVKLISKQIR